MRCSIILTVVCLIRSHISPMAWLTLCLVWSGNCLFGDLWQWPGMSSDFKRIHLYSWYVSDLKPHGTLEVKFRRIWDSPHKQGHVLLHSTSCSDEMWHSLTKMFLMTLLFFQTTRTGQNIYDNKNLSHVALSQCYLKWELRRVCYFTTWGHLGKKLIWILAS